MKFNIPNVEPGDTVEIKVTKAENNTEKTPTESYIDNHMTPPVGLLGYNSYRKELCQPGPNGFIMIGRYGF